MIKVDVVSGFLGAGKTTLIKKLAEVLIKQGEKLVIVENEFGEASIDGKLLQINDLNVVEISRGCICCSLKGDFIASLLKIAHDINPDRIIIEPSGIFILSEVFDIFQSPEVKKSMEINSITTVVDCIHYLSQKRKYSYYFENQIQYSKQIILSKTEAVPAEALALPIMEIQKVNPAPAIFTKAWSEMSEMEFLSLVEANITVINGFGHYDKVQPLPCDHSHKSFSSLTIKPERYFTQESLACLLHKLSQKGYGSIMRVKGFVRSSMDTLLEFNYVDGSIVITELNQKLEPSVCVIGEDLDRYKLSLIFNTLEYG